ncbi:hypothetical protein [Spirosoma foliorum]|uniref:Uncharacterized protein n=1 Tax=Spirosoma foliorum TaxID=2710596 RepID=A0A7G5GYU2_9BACT|nr:hypothetical protein [Spirosoma foliorum]QMW04034.1 hypothetical protein H3H32_03495 [Spirosoma foliorum]
MDQPPFSHTDFIDRANYFIGLPITASAVQVNSLFWFSRLALESLIDHTDACFSYGPAWRLIGQTGEKNLQAYLRGEDVALERLKANVAESLLLLPQ